MRSETAYGNGIFTMIKATLFALVISLLAVMAVAVAYRAGGIQERGLYAVNQAVKGVSIAVGVLTFLRGDKGWLKGGGVGLLFTALSYLAFSAIGGDFSLGWLIIVELVSAFLIGAVSGAFAVNLKK